MSQCGRALLVASLRSPGAHCSASRDVWAPGRLDTSGRGAFRESVWPGPAGGIPSFTGS